MHTRRSHPAPCRPSPSALADLLMSVASGVAIGLFLLFVALVAVKNELFTSFRFMNLGGQGAYFADDDALSMDVATTPYVAPPIKPEMLKIAFCVTGQLARLELLSKIANIFVPNAKMGHLVHLFMLLDDTREVKQTFWRYDYTNTPHATHSAAKLDHFLARKMRIAGVDGHFHARVRVGPPAQDEFEVVDGFVPVKDKVINTDAQKSSTMGGKGVNEKMKEKAPERFKNNLAWMAGLRDCVKWMQVRPHLLESANVPLSLPPRLDVLLL